MSATVVKVAVIAAWLVIAIEIVLFLFGLLSIAVGETGIGGGTGGLLTQLIGMLRTSLQALMAPVVLLIVAEIYRLRRG